MSALGSFRFVAEAAAARRATRKGLSRRHSFLNKNAARRPHDCPSLPAKPFAMAALGVPQLLEDMLQALDGCDDGL